MAFPFKIREFDGPLTEEIVRKPGNFGLGQVPATSAPTQTTSSVCGYCSTGCSLNVHLKDGEAVNLTPTTDYPVNLGMACPKGWETLTPLDAEDRGTTPLVNGQLITWSDAATLFCDRMRSVQDEYGPASTAFLSTGQICTEEMAYLGAFAKFGMGMIHGDGNTRQCMATAVTAYKQSFGFDTPPYTYSDFEESDAIFLIGSNLCIAHPIMWQRVLRNKRNPEIVVIDPRRTETAMQATQHLALAPKSDLILLYGLAHQLIERGAIDRDFIEKNTTAFDDFAKHVAAYDLDRTVEATGIDAETLLKAVDTIQQKERVSFWWTMGVNQSHEATRTAQAIINLALMTGNIGRPGTGANSITGQCNAMGSRLMSNTTNLLGGHDFTNAEHRQKVAEAIGIDVAKIPDQPSWAYDQIMDGIDSGDIRALWVIATNGSHSWIHQKQFTERLRKLDFLVVQDIYPTTETAQLADLYLPAAGAMEKDGTFINSERRIGLVKKVKRAPGQALADFSIFRLLSQAWGSGKMFAEWTSPEAVFQIMKRCSAGQPWDISGIENYRMLDEHGGIQWPCTDASPEQERRLFEDGKFFTPDEKARFIFDETRPVAEPVDSEFPLALLTGRGTSAQWHTQSRTGKSAILRKLYPKSIYLEIHPEDAATRDIENGDEVTIDSRRSQIKARAFVTPTVGRGQVFLPMHYGEVNKLTFPEFDPHSRQPSYKHCAVQVSIKP